MVNSSILPKPTYGVNNPVIVTITVAVTVTVTVTVIEKMTESLKILYVCI